VTQPGSPTDPHAALAERSRLGAEGARALLAHGIGAEGLPSFELAPIAFVAWADGALDADERRESEGAASALGLYLHIDARKPFERWMEERPAEALLELWEAWARALAPEAKAALRGRLERGMERVARASGGFLGIGKVCAAESAVIARARAALATNGAS
jgi:hypothetical protein